VNGTTKLKLIRKQLVKGEEETFPKTLLKSGTSLPSINVDSPAFSCEKNTSIV
jgi:hypothetical protein